MPVVLSLSWFIQGIVAGALLLALIEVYLVIRFVLPLLEPGKPTLPKETAFHDKVAKRQKQILAQTRQRKAAAQQKSDAVVISEEEETDDEQESEWPPNIVSFLRQALHMGESASKDGIENKYHDCEWVNIVLNRMFVEWRRSEQLKAKLKAKVKQQIDKKTGKTGLIVLGFSVRST